jgi:lysophospholipase L1-like esterase
MPVINKESKRMGSLVVTEFVDSVGSNGVTYTLQDTTVQQETLAVYNISPVDLLVSVGTQSNVSVPAYRGINLTESFTSFTIRSVAGVGGFRATCSYEDADETDEQDFMRKFTSQMADLATKQGDVTQLNTTDKSSVVNALKEIKSQANTNTTAVSNIGNGSPKGVYATLSALQTAFPTGTSGVYLVTADGNWYYWNGSAWTAGGVYQSTGISNNSVTSDMTTDNSQFGLMSYTVTPVNFDFNAKTITFYNTTALIFKKARYFLANGSNTVIDISTADPTAMYGLYYNKTANTFSFIGTGSISSVTESLILIATFNMNSKTVNCPSRHTVNGTTFIASGSVNSASLTDVNSTGLMVSNNALPDFNFTTNQITFYANTILLFKTNRYVISSGTNRIIDISTADTTSQYGLYYNKSTDTFSFYTTSAISTGAVSENQILIATFQKTKQLVFMSGSFTINGGGLVIPSNSVTSVTQTDAGHFGLLVATTKYPDFDFINNKISFYANTILIYKNARYIIANGSTFQVDISTLNTGLMYGLYYNKSNNTFSCYDTATIGNGNSALENLILTATFIMNKQLVWIVGQYTINSGGNPYPSLSSRFNGKNGNFIGDSITYGLDPADGTSRLATPFPTLVGQKLGLATINNYGISGSTVGDLGGGVNSPFCERYSTMDLTAELTFVFGGTNDWAKNVPLGVITDNVNSTFFGAYNLLITGLLNQYPTQTIVLATPLHRQGDTVPNASGSSLNDYRNAVIALGSKYGLAVIDLYGTSGFYADNTTNMNALAPDGRHPNAVGHQKLANRVTGFLMTL